LPEQFVEHAYQLRTVQFWITEIWRGRQDLHDEIRSGRHSLDDSDCKILAIFDKYPFKSAHSMAERLLVTYPIVLQYLHESFWFKLFHLHWVPHLSTCDLREKWKEYARVMLPFLHVAEQDGWHHLVTGDELWFCDNILPCWMWTLSRDDVITKPRHEIQSNKLMFTIIKNASGFYVIDRLINQSKMNSPYFVTNILIPIE
jgi:hypothetical protein